MKAEIVDVDGKKHMINTDDIHYLYIADDPDMYIALFRGGGYMHVTKKQINEIWDAQRKINE